jgi:hypothetical protein
MPAITARPVVTLVAVLVVAILGGAYILGRSDQNVGTPSSTPSPSPSATPYPSPLPLPSALVGGWLAPLRDAPIAQGLTSVIYFGALDGNPDAPDFVLGGAEAPADVREISPGLIELTATSPLGGCSTGDVGHYRWSTSADGGWLTLDQVDDACPNRAAVVPGTWVRSGSHDSHGGPVVSAGFEPFFSFTLPTGDWLGGGSAGMMSADRTEATFKVWQDPVGFNDFCNDALGRKVLERGINPFLQVLREDSGLTVSNERETTIDGRRAVIVDIGGKPDVQPPCWTNPDTGESGMILQWAEHADVYAKWATEIGSAPWPIVITEVDGHTIVFEAVRADGTSWVLDQETIDSVRFLDELPTPPTS